MASTVPHQIHLSEAEMPTQWYNLIADLPTPPPPALHPGTHQPAGPDDFAPLFPMALIEQATKMRASRDQKDQSAREAATAIASALVPKTITVTAKASSEGKLFGSIHAAEIAEAIKEQTDIDIDRKMIEVDNIKTVGPHTATASLHSDVSFPITLDVVAAE